ncbi:MAG: EAL domain-containing protein [Bacteroidetes bacterium]|nr:EAL domain-containing protein [Bacteroidota bacterium]
MLERAHQLLRVGGWEYRPPTDTLRWTDEMYRFFALSPDHTPQLTTFVQLCAPSAQPALRRALTRALDAGTPFDLELPFMTAQGHPRWGRVLCEPGAAEGPGARLTGTLQDITDRKDAEEALADEQDLLDRIIATSAMAIAVVDAAGHIVFANDRAGSLLHGLDPAADSVSIEGMPYLPPTWTVTDLDDQPLAPDDVLHRQVIRRGAPVFDYACALHRPDGPRRVLSMRAAPLTDDADRVVRVVLSIEDITDQQAAEQVLREDREFLDTLLNQVHAGVVACDADGGVTLMNRTSKQWHGLPARDGPPDRWAEHYRLFRLDGTTPMPTREVPLYRALNGETVRAAEMVIAPDEGARRIVECNAQPLHADDGALRGAVLVMHDVTRRRELKDQLHHQAHYDALTGLPNRTHFLEACKRAIEQRDAGQTPYAILFIDLDRFKSVNDSLGHHAGNLLLQIVARRIQHTTRESDCVARFSGDEFVVLLQPAEEANRVARIATRIADALQTPFDLEGETVRTTASIGMVMGHARHHVPEDVLREADMAMYRAKLRSEGPLFFDPSLGEEIRTQFFLEADLYRALQRDEFVVAYQPIVRLADGALAGFEALVRWQHPERGLLTPGAFIGVAEESGLITDIDRWMIRAACEQAHRWQARFGANAVPLLHVNCAYRTFLDASLSDYVSEVLAAARLAPSQLALEVTERELVEDLDRVIDEMEQFKSQNIRLCIDDFGVKYSSLGVLQQLPVDNIKVDRSFIRHIDGSGANQEIVRTMIDLADRMGLSLVAEGLETPEQLAVLQQLGYPLGQGYLIARPLDAQDATACVAGERPWMTHWTDVPPERPAGL